MHKLKKRLSVLKQRFYPPRATMGIYQLLPDGSARFLEGDPSPDANLKIYLHPDAAASTLKEKTES